MINRTHRFTYNADKIIERRIFHNVPNTFEWPRGRKRLGRGTILEKLISRRADKVFLFLYAVQIVLGHRLNDLLSFLFRFHSFLSGARSSVFFSGEIFLIPGQALFGVSPLLLTQRSTRVVFRSTARPGRALVNFYRAGYQPL